MNQNVTAEAKINLGEDVVANNKSKRFRWRVFFAAYLAYASLHALRSSWGSIKPHVGTDMGWSNTFLGALDTVFLIIYGFGLLICGILGDYFNKRYLLCIGMFVAFLGYLAIGVAGWLQKMSKVFIVFAFAINGLGESSGLPNHIAILGAWFAGPHLKTILGFWMSNQCVGDLIGQQFAGWLYDDTAAWSWTRPILACSGFLILGIILVFCFEYTDPVEAKLEKEKIEDEEPMLPANEEGVDPDSLEPARKSLKSNKMPPGAISAKFGELWTHFTLAWKIPNFVAYIITYSCGKACNYTLMFWLPTYLAYAHFDATSQVPWLQLSCTIGQFIGTITAGALSDYLKTRAFVIPFYAFSGFAAFIVLILLPEGNFWLYFFFLFIAGLFSGVPYNYTGGALAADLGRSEIAKGHPNLTATIPGTIDGIGSVFAGLVGLGLSTTSNSIFWLATGLCFISGIAVVPIAIEEFKEMRKAHRS